MKRKLGKVFLTVGVCCIAAAIALTGYTIYSASRAGQNAEVLLQEVTAEIPAVDSSTIPDYILNPDMEMPTINIDGDPCIGILEMPAIQRELPIISQWEFDRLRVAPCRYAGSAYKDDLIIAAHNYDAHFGKLSQLQMEDKVLFTDAVGNRFQYKVVQMEFLEPTDVKEMKSGEWDLTLFTCNPAITHRIAVRCERI